MPISGVYKILNKKTKKFYIGHSIEIEKRFWRHKYELERGCHHCIYLQRSWNKYGPENFEFIVINECSEEVPATILHRIKSPNEKYTGYFYKDDRG